MCLIFVHAAVNIQMELPPILIPTKQVWHSGGVKGKPLSCQSCAQHPYTTGFCPDWVGAEPQIAIMLTAPTKDEVNNYSAFDSDMGAFILHRYIYPFGFKKSNLIITNVLRCNQPWDKRYKREGYPTGTMREKAEITCRMYDDKRAVNGELRDGGLKQFNPNMFLLSLSPKEVKRVPAYHRQILANMAKARKFVDDGYRPLILFGNEAAELFAPYIRGAGGVKGWTGHFWAGDFRFAGFVN